MKMPDIAALCDSSIEELKYLSIIEVSWLDCFVLSFTFNDGQSCKAGLMGDVNKSHTFD